MTTSWSQGISPINAVFDSVSQVLRRPVHTYAINTRVIPRAVIRHDLFVTSKADLSQHIPKGVSNMSHK